MLRTGETIYEKIDMDGHSLVKDKTFRETAEAWLALGREKMAATTYNRYSDALERDIYPEYGDVPMSRVNEDEMNRFLRNAPELAKQQGRNLGKSGLMVVRAVMSGVIQYARNEGAGDSLDLSYEVNSYEELSQSEIEMICIKAKYNHCTEMLAALLSLFCGLRIGELCALGCDDVDTDRMELFIHRTVHRIRNTDKDSDKKTMIVVEEQPRKKQIRRVKIPGVLKEYIKEFSVPGRMLIRKNDGGEPADPRSLEGRLDRVMEAFRLKNISFERLRKTYVNGTADQRILTDVFLGEKPDRPYMGTLDIKWLTDEMSNDLAPLRMLVGLSANDMSRIMGLPLDTYCDIESGNKNISWDEYLSLLFLFHYNSRTIGIVENLGLFPRSLREKIKIGTGA